jgi:pyridoxine 5-phosphate synthase
MNPQLSINLNKVALIRNSRGANYPDLLQVALDCEAFGAQGITIHPRPDERHAKFSDIPLLKNNITTELNIEGYPSERFLQAVLQHRPHQCTLVPDPPGAITSDNGWDTHQHRTQLTDIVHTLRNAGIRTSLFVNPDPHMIEGAKHIGTDRIELFTGNYAHQYPHNPQQAIAPYIQAAQVANQLGIGINAGHDLNLHNLAYFRHHIHGLLEVSIGHALTVDALYYGYHNTIRMYLQCLQSY